MGRNVSKLVKYADEWNYACAIQSRPTTFYNRKEFMKYLVFNHVITDLIYKDHIEYEWFKFNGGEPHIKLKCNNLCGENVSIVWPSLGECSLMLLLLATDALRRCGAGNINLVMPYVPFARQDRVMVTGEPLSIKVFTDVINSQGYNIVYTLDNHSPVSTALINNCREIKRDRIIKIFTLNAKSDSVLIAPDAGAIKKTFEISKQIGFPVVTASKQRDVSDGKIIGVNVETLGLHGADCYVIDDICDGGRTFVELAKRLKTLNCGKLHLYVSHGIFSKGLKELCIYYDIIACTTFKGLKLSKVIPLRKEDLR